MKMAQVTLISNILVLVSVSAQSRQKGMTSVKLNSYHDVIMIPGVRPVLATFTMLCWSEIFDMGVAMGVVHKTQFRQML